METSKRIVIFILVIYLIAMAASFTLPVLFDYAGETVLKVYQATATLTGSVLIGYFGKAGFENYDKHRNLLGFEENREEGGNG